MNRKRKESESYEEYRANLKAEALKEKLKLKPWLLPSYLKKYGLMPVAVPVPNKQEKK